MKLSKKHYAGILAVLLTLGFIFINSLMSGELSMWLSTLPKRIVQSFIPYGKYRWLDNFLINRIRKFAHIFEYAVLGFIVAKFYYYNNKTYQRLINTLFICFSVAFLDETLQLFSHRQSKISDTWIDLFGVAFGFAVYFTIDIIKRNSKEAKNERNYKK